jgi:predicted alpha-1,2-mannosidase
VRRALPSCLALLALAAAPARADLAGYVNPFDGTAVGAKDFGTGGGAGNTFPGPVVPFGMIQWGPDTSSGTHNAGGGYAYGDSRILGFSTRRLSGAGCPNGGDFDVLPTTKAIDAAPTEANSPSFTSDVLPGYSHADEEASPGYYRVGLDPNGQRINSELTSTIRSGLGRFTFPDGDRQTVLLNATSDRMGATAGEIHIDAAHHEVTAQVTTGAFCYMPSRYRIYMVARFDRPFAAVGTWKRQTLSPGATDASDTSDANPAGLLDPSADPVQKLPTMVNGFDYLGNGGQVPTAQAGGYVMFDPAGGRTVGVRVGISFTSAEEARRNLDAEAGSRSFDDVRAAARAAWDRALGAIEVSGGELADTQTFYSMLYRALVSPTTYSDADGAYLGMDGATHRVGGRHVQYADFSGWDVYRSQMPLLALIAPRVAGDIARSMVADERDSGWLPRWSVANTQAEIMSGDPADAILASLWALGAHRFDPARALDAMVKGATTSSSTTADPRNSGYVERPGLAAYLARGWVPDEQGSDLLGAGIDTWRRALTAPAPAGADIAWGSAGSTLEYAIDDFAISRLAAAQGRPDVCRTFLARSGNWRNVFDSSIGYAHPRYANGQFTPNYDPNYNDSLSGQGFAEGDGAQYTWMVPQDPAGLASALGGRGAALARLDSFFSELNAGFSSPHAFLGNEPNSNAPWLYDWLGEPSKAQDIMRRAILGLFDASAGGYPGNDDLGQMSAWYVFGALGLYPAQPGTDVLAIGSPLFPHAVLHLASGDVTIDGDGASRTTPYVQSLDVDGQSWSKPWLRLRDLAGGARLRFALGADPETGWATDPAAAPPSFAPDSGSACGDR